MSDTDVAVHGEDSMGKKAGKRERRPIPILKRGEQKRESKPVPAPDPSDELCDAILAAKVTVGDEEDMTMEAMGVLGQALEGDELSVEGEDREMMVGNILGRTYGRLPPVVEQLTKEKEALEQSAAADATLIEKQECQIEDLQAQVRHLTDALGLYRLSRQRYISTFKRDKMKDTNPVDRELIREGSEAVHGGDAHTDAGLYAGVGGRADVTAFQTLYGFLPETVSGFSK